MTETQLAEYTKIVENPKLQNSFRFLIGVIGRARQAAYRKLAKLKGDGSTFGLELTIRYGSNMDILVFLAFGELGSDTKVQDLVDEAIKKLTPTEREYLTKIQKSEPETKTFFQELVEKSWILDDHEKFIAIVKNDETAILAMQLSVWMDFTELGGALLIFAKPEIKKELFDAGAAIVAEGKCMGTWKTIARFHNDYKHLSSLKDYEAEAW